MGKTRGPILTGLVLLLLLTEGVRIAWFTVGASRGEGEPVFTLALPSEREPGIQLQDLAETRGGKMLSYDYGGLFRIFDHEDERWRMDVFYREYKAGNGNQLKDLFDHSPEVCLPASGSKLERTFPHLETLVDGQPVFARHLLFRHPTGVKQFHVFKLIWLAGMEEFSIRGQEVGFRNMRLKAAWFRHSRPPARLILASLSGDLSDQEARALFQREILARCSFVNN